MDVDPIDKCRVLEDVIENIPGGVFQLCIHDAGTMHFTYRSRRAYELAHLPPDWQLGINAHPEDRDRLIESVHEAVRTGSHWSFEGRCILASGDNRWVEGSATPVRTGDEIIFNGLLLDVTDRKRAEETLYESNERFRNAFDNAAIGMALVSPEGQFVKVNQSLCKMLGYCEQELLQLTYADVTHPDDRETSRIHAQQLRDGKISEYQMEKRYLKKSGEVVWVLLAVSEVRDECGDLIYMVSQSQDITEQKQAEQDKLRFYRDTIRSITQGKLALVSSEEVLPYLESAELSFGIASSADTVDVRHCIREFCELKCGDVGQWELFETAVGEAMTNAIKHAGNGQVYAGVKSDIVWVAVTDTGTGIPAIILPRATLYAGFSTKVSMGMGYAIMLEASDCILICTGLKGTSVVLQRDTVAPEPVLSLDDFPDTWG